LVADRGAVFSVLDFGVRVRLWWIRVEAYLVVDHFLRGWRLMKKKRRVEGFEVTSKFLWLPTEEALHTYSCTFILSSRTGPAQAVY